MTTHEQNFISQIRDIILIRHEEKISWQKARSDLYDLAKRTPQFDNETEMIREAMMSSKNKVSPFQRYAQETVKTCNWLLHSYIKLTWLVSETRLYPVATLVEREKPLVPISFAKLWIKNGGKGHISGKMIAPITDPIWKKISRFGFPFSPFTYYSGMDITGIHITECAALGITARPINVSDVSLISPPPLYSIQDDEWLHSMLLDLYSYTQETLGMASS